MFDSPIFKELEKAAHQADPVVEQKGRSFNNEEDVVWRPHTRKECNGEQIGLRQIYRLRLLPNKMNYKNPVHDMYTKFATIKKHYSFMKPSYDCATNYGEVCHICELQKLASRDMWDNQASYTNEEKDFIRDMRAREFNFVHVLVVEDKHRPQNEGKVFLMEMKSAVTNLIEKHKSVEEMEIEGRPQDVCEVFSLSSGAELVLVVDYNKPNQEIYSSTNFQKCNTPFVQSEEEGKKAIEAIHDLSDKDARFFDKYLRSGDAVTLIKRYLAEEPKNQMKLGLHARQFLEKFKDGVSGVSQAKVSGNPTVDFNTFDDDVPFDVPFDLSPSKDKEVDFSNEKTVNHIGDIPIL